METQATQQTSTIGETAQSTIVPIAALLAVLSASCCVLPIGLSIVGLGGSWLTMLAPFVVYREAILVVVAIALVWAWYRVLRPRGCVKRRASSLIWAGIGSTAFLLAASSPLWEASASKFMWGLFRSTL